MAKVRKRTESVVPFATDVIDQTIPLESTPQTSAVDVLIEWIKETDRAAQLARIQREYFVKHFDGVYSIDNLPIGYLGDNAKEVIAAYNRGRRDERDAQLKEQPVIAPKITVQTDVPESVPNPPKQTPVKPVSKPVASSTLRPNPPIVQNPVSPPKIAPRERERPSNKEIVYKMWLDSKTNDIEAWAKLVPDVKASSVKSWVRDWENGVNYPACAKDYPPSDRRSS